MTSILSPDEIKDLPNEGLKKLAKEAPEVVKRMGCSYYDYTKRDGRGNARSRTYEI